MDRVCTRFPLQFSHKYDTFWVCSGTPSPFVSGTRGWDRSSFGATSSPPLPRGLKTWTFCPAPFCCKEPSPGWPSSHPCSPHSPGQKVCLQAKNIPLKTNSRKLSPRLLGPLEVTAIIHPAAVKLPGSLKVHLVFHVSQLKPVRHSALCPLANPPPPTPTCAWSFYYHSATAPGCAPPGAGAPAPGGLGRLWPRGAFLDPTLLHCRPWIGEGISLNSARQVDLLLLHSWLQSCAPAPNFIYCQQLN